MAMCIQRLLDPVKWGLIQKVQDLEQQLAISRLMTEHYRRLLVDTYVELGLLRCKKENHEQVH